VLCPQPILNALLCSNERSADFSDNLVAKLVQPLNFLLLHVKLLNERRGFRSVRGIQQPMLVYRYRFEITLHLLTRGWSWHPTIHCQAHL
jgi:hypothetical protein